MKQFGCQKCMKKEQEEKWYPQEEEKWCAEEQQQEWYAEEQQEEWRPEEQCQPRPYQPRPCQPRPCQQRPRREECGCKVIVEPTVYCKQEKHYHHCVKHIVPVVCKQVENHHFDHEYVIEKKVVKEEHRYDHGRRQEDWCKLAGCGKDQDCDC